MTRRRLLLAGLILAGWLAGPVGAQSPTARAYLSQAQVPLNAQFVLNVEIQGSQQLAEDPRLPDMSAFSTYLGSSTSTSMQIDGGRMSTSLTIQYRFQATQEGSFEIGPVVLEAGRQDLSTEPLVVEIVTAAPPPAPGIQPGADGVEPDDLFLTATLDKDTVYVNEPAIVEYRIFTRVDVEGYNLRQQPSTAGFWVEVLSSPQGRVESVVREGVQYASSVIRRVALFPTSDGVKPIEPLTLEAQVRMQRRDRRRDPFGGLFGSSLFGSRVPVAIASNGLELAVQPLPPGAPESFTGLVGALSVSAVIDNMDTATNEALTLQIEVAGTGNLRALADPVLTLPDTLEVYPPETTEQVEATADGVHGRKTYEYVVVPRAPGQLEIPPVELAYLDAERGEYAVATSDPIIVTVSGDPEPPPTLSGRLPRSTADLQRQDIRFIRVTSPVFHANDQTIFRSVGFWAVAVLPLLAVAGAVFARRHQDRLAGDVAYARDRRASTVAKRRLTRAESLCKPEHHREFHAEIGRAMQGFLGDKLNIAEAGLIQADIRAGLAARGASADVIDSYLSCLERCDRQRFAPTTPDSEAMRSMLTTASHAMADLEGALS
ncbi:MAG: BatD family protein [Acidobacteriota bacterium]|nr:BatD family protein [Acidobacteriota bacterium]